MLRWESMIKGGFAPFDKEHLMTKIPDEISALSACVSDNRQSFKINSFPKLKSQ
jgi:hypothetical protein